MINYIETRYKSILLLLIILLCSKTANSLNVMELVHHVLDTHPVIMANEKSLDAFQYRYYQTFGNFLPELNISRTENREKINNEPSGISKRYLNTRMQDFSLTQNIFAGFKDFNANRAAMWNYKSTKESATFNINAILLDAIIFYINVLQQEKLLLVAEENQKFFRKSLTNLEKLFEAGATDKADYLLVKNNLENANSNMLQTKKDYDSVVAKFKYALNLDPVNLAPLKSIAKYISPSPEEHIKSSLENNPSIKEIRAKLKTLEYEFRQQVSDFFPTLDLNISRNTSMNINGVTGKSASNKIGINANFNLFKGGKDYLETQAKATEKISLAHQLEAVTRNIKQEVSENWLIIQNTYDKKDLIEKQIVSSEQSLNSYLVLFEHNRAYLLNVLNAKKILFSSQTENVINNSNKLIHEHRILILNNSLIPSLDAAYSLNKS